MKARAKSRDLEFTSRNALPSIGLFALIVLLGPRCAHAQTGMPYNPSNRTIQYQFCEAGGLYGEASHLISLNWQTFDHDFNMRQELVSNAYFGNHPLFHSYPDGGIGVCDQIGTWTNPNGTEKRYFGEVGNPLQGFLVVPGEPKLSVTPAIGEHMQFTCIISSTLNGPVQYSTLPVSYWTVAHYDSFGQWVDVWRTCLVEYYPEGSTAPDAFYDVVRGLYIRNVYNYFYALNIGLVQLWWGSVDAAGKLEGWSMTALSVKPLRNRS